MYSQFGSQQVSVVVISRLQASSPRPASAAAKAVMLVRSRAVGLRGPLVVDLLSVVDWSVWLIHVAPLTHRSPVAIRPGRPPLASLLPYVFGADSRRPPPDIGFNYSPSGQLPHRAASSSRVCLSVGRSLGRAAATGSF